MVEFSLQEWAYTTSIFMIIQEYLTDSEMMKLQLTCKFFRHLVDQYFERKYTLLCQKLKGNIEESRSVIVGLDFGAMLKANPSLNPKLLYFLAIDKRSLEFYYRGKLYPINPPKSIPKYHPFANRDGRNLLNWWACIQTIYSAPEWLFYYSVSSISTTYEKKRIMYHPKYHQHTKAMLSLMRHTLLYVISAWFLFATYPYFDPIWGLLWKGNIPNVDIVLTYCFLALFGFAEAMMLGLVMEQSSTLWLLNGVTHQKTTVLFLLLETIGVMTWTNGLIPFLFGIVYIFLILQCYTWLIAIRDNGDEFKTMRYVVGLIFLVLCFFPLALTTVAQFLFMWWVLALHILQVLFVDNWQRVANVSIPVSSTSNDSNVAQRKNLSHPQSSHHTQSGIRFDSEVPQSLLRLLFRALIGTICMFYILVFTSLLSRDQSNSQVGMV